MKGVYGVVFVRGIALNEITVIASYILCEL